MGDISDMNDCERFCRSAEGKAYLEEASRMLKGHTIVDVSFSNEVHFIATTLHFEDGTAFFLSQPSLMLEAIREQFSEVLEREYFVDFPERRPGAVKPKTLPQRASKHSRLIPVTMIKMVTARPPGDKGRISLKPTVLIVMMVM